jgi:hypothetical protein
MSVASPDQWGLRNESDGKQHIEHYRSKTEKQGLGR